ncbi:peptidoglycan-binding protein [Streptomyces capoamus]|uniref:peptidoglycan-binding protein n=1 Tax=Streptomyces capoamus TaxID=68183 RepID=UPI0033980764
MPTPPDPGQPPPGQVPEPVRVLRPRSFDALAELMREFRPDPVTFAPLGTAPAPPARTARPSDADIGPAEADTREIPPVRAPRRSNTPPAAPRPAPPRTAPPRSAPPRAAAVPGSGTGPRRAAVAVAVAAAALVGFAGALLLPGRQQAAATAAPSPPATTAPPPSAPSATAPAAPTPSPPASGAADPDGPGTLRQGDTGPGVTDLQQRLLRVPDVYRGGSASGTYDATLTEAVARFQLWYGISGDERGVYGDDTRRALESRTGIGNDA